MDNEIKKDICFPVEYWEHCLTIEDSNGKIIIDLSEFKSPDKIGVWLANLMNEDAVR